MRKMTFLACAALLTSAVVFTSCKNDNNEPQQKAPEVKTEFSIALPDQLSSNGANRMPGKTVQQGNREDFQGMTDITLIPFAKLSDVEASDNRLGTNIALGDIAAASELGTLSNAKVYTNVSIPLTTSTFLFYAQSKATDFAAGTEFQKGSLRAVDLDYATPADFHFDLEPIIANLATAHGDAKAVALLAYVNSLADALDGATPTPHAWKEYDTADPTTYEPAMAAMFAEFKKLHTLSSYGIQSMVEDLYNSLIPISEAVPATPQKTLAANIMDAIDAQADITGAGPKTVTLSSALSGYPANIKLPDQAVHIKWSTSTKHFEFLTEAEYDAANYPRPYMYTYPSSLWYYANSQISTANSTKQAMYNNTNDWATILGAHNASKAVNTNTRAVAIDEPIQYAVARMDLRIKLQAGTLEDNTPTTPKNITCGAYTVTGVFVGGQKNVGFDFTPKGSEIYTIYDNAMTSANAATPAPMQATTDYSEWNRTLVLETAKGPAADKDVRIAVEFTNDSGEDFVGVDGCIIPKGGKFYVVANLASSAADETALSVAGKQYCVFAQDFITKVQLNLKSLKNAYNTIPDLRTPQLELGFSVNLEWQAGHTYTIDIN